MGVPNLCLKFPLVDSPGSSAQVRKTMTGRTCKSSHKRNLSVFIVVRAGLGFYNYTVKRHGYNVKQHEYNVKQHDCNVTRHDYTVKWHDYNVKRHDYIVKRHDYNDKRNDYKYSKYHQSKTNQISPKLHEIEAKQTIAPNFTGSNREQRKLF